MAPDVFTKHSPDAPEGFFEVEAAGLVWLAEAGPDSAQVVAVHHVDSTSITLDRVPQGRPSPAAAEAFGHALARTHAAGAAAFGQGPDGWQGEGFIGSQPLSLRPDPQWGRHYAEQRMLPYAHQAARIGNLSGAGLTVIEELSQRLVDGAFDDDAAPSRIHGDLWAGNVMWSPHGVVLIDPAAQGGHGLTDLGMLSLFGAPHLDTILSAYGEAAAHRLPSRWRDLLELHELHHLLVHAVTHGPGYGDRAVQIARGYL